MENQTINETELKLQEAANQLLVDAGIDKIGIFRAADKVLGNTLQIVLENKKDYWIVLTGTGLARLDENEYEKYVSQALSHMKDKTDDEKETFVQHITIQYFDYKKLEIAEKETEKLLKEYEE